MHCCDLGFGIKFPFPIYLHTEFPAPTSRCNSRSSVMELGDMGYIWDMNKILLPHMHCTLLTQHAVLNFSKHCIAQSTRTLWSILR